jgi:hypothetical protein
MLEGLSLSPLLSPAGRGGCPLDTNASESSERARSSSSPPPGTRFTRGKTEVYCRLFLIELLRRGHYTDNRSNEGLQVLSVGEGDAGHHIDFFFS